MDPHAEPLRPIGTVTRVQLEQYALGRLDASERHRIELHLEQDPLLRDAVEGLQLPGALPGLKELERRRPGGSTPALRMLYVGAVIFVGLVAIVLLVNEDPVPRPEPARVEVIPDRPFKADSALAVLEHELIQASPVPAPQQIGHDPVHVPVRTIEDSTTLQVLTPRHDTPPVLTAPPSLPTAPPTAPPATRSGNRKLAFIHDLKLVDPKELYDRGPWIMEPGGVPAGFADDAERDQRSEPPRTMPYLNFMDVALGKFIRNDHRGCLEDLLFLMGQYPKDINARFYAGLCCYNLGLLDRAKAYLAAVVSDPIDTFREEAAWYLALTIERAEGLDAARPHFEQVQAGGGSYAARAAGKLKP
jgi:hypothetical protein